MIDSNRRRRRPDAQTSGRAGSPGSIWRLVALAAATMLLLSACGSGSGSGAATSGTTSTGAASARASFDFTSETVDGEPFDGATLSGKPTVLWFWAPWCPSCRAQIDGVGELADTYGADVNVVGVGSLDEPAAIEGFAADVSPAVTMLADPDGVVWREFGVTAQSTYVVLDADGNEQASGYLPGDELADLVEDLAN